MLYEQWGNFKGPSDAAGVALLQHYKWRQRQTIPINRVSELMGWMMGKIKKRPGRRSITVNVAEWTGLEPATPGVTGRYSNQLNYHSAVKQKGLHQGNPLNSSAAKF